MQRRMLPGLCCLIFFFAYCSDKGEAIIEPRLALIRFTTYTVDTFRFRIVLNDQVLTDSLLSPTGTFNTSVRFLASSANLKVTDAKTNQVIVDSAIKLTIGQSTISFVQFVSGQRPSIPILPAEPPPAAGNIKVRFQYVQPSSINVPFFDSIRCIINATTTPIDTIKLKKYDVSRYYQVPAGIRLQMTLNNPATGTLIDNTTNSLNSNGFSDFNTIIVYGTASGNPYNFSLQRIY